MNSLLIRRGIVPQMAILGKKGKKAEKAPPKAAAKGASAKQTKQPKPTKPTVPPDVYTLLLGLAALFFITATVILGLGYYWYQTADPAVVPMSWAR
jgi:hypothetical protein